MKLRSLKIPDIFNTALVVGGKFNGNLLPLPEIEDRKDFFYSANQNPIGIPAEFNTVIMPEFIYCVDYVLFDNHTLPVIRRSNLPIDAAREEVVQLIADTYCYYIESGFDGQYFEDKEEIVAIFTMVKRDDGQLLSDKILRSFSGRGRIRSLIDQNYDEDIPF